MTAGPQLEPDARLCLLAEADVLLVLAGLLAAKDATVLERLAALAASADDVCARACPDDAGFAPALQGLATAARALGWDALRFEYARLHDAAAPCPINETAYVRREKGPILADVAGFYRAFGLVPGANGEKLDHLATELEFLALLLVLEAQACAVGDTEARDVTARAVGSFVTDHVDAFLGGFCANLAAATESAFHRDLASVLARFWDGFLARRGIARAEPAPASAPGGDELAFDCGGCAGGDGA